MKTIFRVLYKSKIDILYTWIFFFLLSIVVKSPYSIFQLLCISLIFSITMFIVGIVITFVLIKNK